MKSPSILSATEDIRQWPGGGSDSICRIERGADTIFSMETGVDPISELYAALDESDLLQRARDYDCLTQHAQTALRAEFARRGMEAPVVEEARWRPRRLVTLRQFRDLSEAIVARSLLESAGIEVFLQDENLVRLDWQVSNFIGGIRLQVDERDSAVGMELLTEPMED